MCQQESPRFTALAASAAAVETATRATSASTRGIDLHNFLREEPICKIGTHMVVIEVVNPMVVEQK